MICTSSGGAPQSGGHELQLADRLDAFTHWQPDLADKICALLLRDRGVETAELFGSLTSSEPDGFAADDMSDIDIQVKVRSTTDRALCASLEGILVAGWLRPLAKNLFVGSQGILANFMFEGYSPFWNDQAVSSFS